MFNPQGFGSSENRVLLSRSYNAFSKRDSCKQHLNLAERILGFGFIPGLSELYGACTRSANIGPKGIQFGVTLKDLRKLFRFWLRLRPRTPRRLPRSQALRFLTISLGALVANENQSYSFGLRPLNPNTLNSKASPEVLT